MAWVTIFNNAQINNICGMLILRIALLSKQSTNFVLWVKIKKWTFIFCEFILISFFQPNVCTQHFYIHIFSCINVLSSLCCKNKKNFLTFLSPLPTHIHTFLYKTKAIWSSTFFPNSPLMANKAWFKQKYYFNLMFVNFCLLIVKKNYQA